MSTLADRVAATRERIQQAGGRDVELVAVTKGFGPDVVAEAVGVGLTALGESYLQEFKAKLDALDARGVVVEQWHVIGRLQRNKIRLVAPRVALWQSVDRVEVGAEIARRAPGAAVLVQVNITDEPQKGGCPPAQVERLAEQLNDLGLEVRGLMGVGPAGDRRRAATAFRSLVALADRLMVPIRSIGMSDDLEVAIAEGSTMVRIGRELFGERPPRVSGTAAAPH